MTTFVKKENDITFKLVLTPHIKEIKVPVSSDFKDADMSGFVKTTDMKRNHDQPIDEIEAIDCHIRFIKDCVEYRNYFRAKEAIEKMPKKRNGTFIKNRVVPVISSSIAYASPQEYGYRVDELRWKAIDDTTAELQLVSVVHKW